MKDILSLLIIMPVLLFFMFQPIHNQLVDLRGKALENVVNYGLIRAAVAGEFTEELKEEMITLLEKTGKDRNLIDIESNTDIDGAKLRGEYIHLQISYPMRNLWAMPGVLEGTKKEEYEGLYYVRSGWIMSEFLGR